LSTLRFLRTFAMVARYGSFAVAAEHMALTQSAVSMQMRALEELFNHPLFDRAGRTISLNAMGQALLPHAEEILAQFEAMRMMAAGLETQAGPVTIGTVESAVSAVAQAVARIKTAQPALEMRIVTARSMELALRLDAGEIDCAILVEAQGRRPARMLWTPLYTEPIVMLAPASTESTSIPTLLEKERFLRFDATQRTGMVIDRALRRHGLKANTFLELSSLEGLVALVRQAVGVAVVPLLLHSTWAQEDTLRVLPLPGETTYRSVGMVERAQHDKRSITQMIAQHLSSAI
jgi:DNA-binding transcriptional LysR family regulator